MYAIVEITGKQYKVEKDAIVDVDTFDAEADSSVKFDTVLMYVDGEKVLVGKPYLTNVKVSAKVIGDLQGKKVRGMKFKRRKNYQRFKSDRAQLTSLKVEGITLA
jgi:large subunit ribosomal protein L21